MKTFRYPAGHVAGATMTVAELRSRLSDYPDEMPVFGTWETVNGYIRPENFSVETVSKGYVADACSCLLIDVEQY